jgi:acyl transferase domain-containing protein/surfactin synthase thioesterase subunit
MKDLSSGIAVIGMACRFPGAPSVEQFWRNLKEGRESISFFDIDELEPDLRQLAKDPNYVRAGGIIEDVDLFDAVFFKMSPREATLTDPQHRLFLECAWTALESAGYGDGESRGGVVGCYAGSWASSYPVRAAAQVATPADEFQVLVGGGLDYLTTLVSYKLNLTGESLAVQTACSTSLVAVHLACQSLMDGDIDMALAGGVSIDARQKTGYLYQDGLIFSPDGHCRPFDRLAKGTVRGYGLGLVVLKRLEDAVRDRDHVHAVIRRTAVNNDGHHKIGYTAPSGRGQTDVITTAMVFADVRADTIGYVEAHGTGTPLGDPIEIEALTRAFVGVRTSSCAIGSVKSNFGHLVEAAGVAGLIKTVCALEHGVIPPTVHFVEPNPQIDFPRTPFFVANRLTRWPLDGVRRAGVSSFGIGGTNAHAVLEAWTPTAPPRGPEHVELFTLSAETPDALVQLRANLAAWIKVHIEASLGDVAFTLNTGRQPLRYRWACVAANKIEVICALAPEGEPEDTPAGWSVTQMAEIMPPKARVRPSFPADHASLQELGKRWVRGERIDFRPLYESRNVRRIPLPTYPFQRKRYWLDALARTSGPRGFGPWLGQAVSSTSGPERDERSELLLLAGDSNEQLRRRVNACRVLAGSPEIPSLSALCLVASSQAAGDHRLAAVARSREELAGLLEGHLHGNTDARLLHSPAAAPPQPRIAFVFSGQGGQWWGMGRDLLREEPIFRRTLETCAEVLDRLADPLSHAPFMELWSAPERASRIGETDVAQPAQFALQVGLAAMWRSWGITPDVVVGHSLGEVAAAHIAGALSLEDALRVVYHRSRLMKRLAGRGRTASVELSMEEAERAIAGYEDRLAVAGSNAPTASVLSGAPDALEEVLAKLRARRVFCRELRVDVAFHSPQMDAIVPELEDALARVTPRAAAVPIYSTVLAGPIDGASQDARYWGKNVREPFRFAATVECMVADDHVRFLEIGPHPVLSHAIEQSLQRLGREGAVLPSLHRNWPDRDVMLRSLGALFTGGHAVTWPPLEQLPAAVEGAPAEGGPLTTLQRVRALVAEVLLAGAGDLPDDVPLVDMGMDSVTGLALIGKLEAAFGVQIGTNELIVLGTIARIAKRIEGSADERAAKTVRLPLRASPEPKVDVVLFPGAAGTALMLAPWTSPDLLESASISAMHPPGHGSDTREPLRRMSELVDLYVKALLPLERPLVLVGYSLGGLVAYAVAHALEQLKSPVRSLIVSHTLPPPVWREMMFSRGERFVEIFGKLYKAWGVDAQSRSRFLEAARADFEAAESFDVPATKLSALTCIIASPTDDFAPSRRILGWNALCARPAHYAAVGGHWDFLDHQANRDLLRLVYTRACSVGQAWITPDERLGEADRPRTSTRAP